MLIRYIFDEMERNGKAFFNLLSGLEPETYLWKPQADKWCLLEIVCHLVDEEKEDFRARVKKILEAPEAPYMPIDPQGWVVSRKYIEQDYNKKVEDLWLERQNSLEWLRSLQNPNWKNVTAHPALGEMSAEKMFYNWLAHDYFHIRQITRTKRQLLETTGMDLSYAGKW